MQTKCEVVARDLGDISGVLEETEKVIRQCFTQYKTEEVFLSFNGGKDCTVLLDITINVLKQLYNRDDICKSLKVVYIRTNGPFEEIEEFVKETVKYYGVKLVVTDGEMKITLQRLLEGDDRLKAVLMGTRRTDPYCDDLNFMQKTDPSWPQVMRVSPLLNWSYHHIWAYILQRQVPYCRLYDQGYTSIGSTYNTWPNPALACRDSHGTYRPAWELSDGALERAGRGTKPPTVQPNGNLDTQPLNGHPTDTGTLNGHPTDTGTLNGHPTDTGTLNGHPTDTGTLNGHPTDTGTLNGHPTDTKTLNGHPTVSGKLNGHPADSKQSNGRAFIDHCIDDVI